MTLAWTDWIGREESVEDILSEGLITGLRATLGRPGADTPAGAHWLCAPPRALRRDLGSDGHPARGEFLPPIDLPRRMWAGGRLEFHAPLRSGARIQRRSTLASIEEKQGASGRLAFIEVDHQIYADALLSVRERQTIVYREAPREAFVLASPAQEGNSAKTWEWQMECVTDPILLFRYSALTFNGHRIHYDQPYATGVEGYPGLVVHGPLMATMLLDLCAEHLGPDRLAWFTFRGVGPAFCGETLLLAAQPHGESIELRILAQDGRTVMIGQAVIRPNGSL